MNIFNILQISILDFFKSKVLQINNANRLNLAQQLFEHWQS